MPRVADYSIVRDKWVVEAIQDTIEFEVPSNVDAGSRAVLGFMFHADSTDGFSITIRINGHPVWNWKFGDGEVHARYFQEVAAAGVVKPGSNVFSYDGSGEGKRFVQLSDIVIWWQANI